eukprot:GHRQ01024502.1.p1 GENE.GHRQ01024502.1~~GHRQ01024502.1.p1  ORF type:complete len:210 (+),score=66.08 GHRQ01024502.1:1021-1650(+)
MHLVDCLPGGRRYQTVCFCIAAGSIPCPGKRVVGTTGEEVCVRKEPDLQRLEQDLQAVLASGINSIAVVLKHAAIYPEHEKLVGQLASKMGFKQVSLSHAVMPMVKMVPRGFTAAADAYLTPHILRCEAGTQEHRCRRQVGAVQVEAKQRRAPSARLPAPQGHGRGWHVRDSTARTFCCCWSANGTEAALMRPNTTHVCCSTAAFMPPC